MMWQSIDFVNKTMTVSHSVKLISSNGINTVKVTKNLKRNSSYRTLPIPQPLLEHLITEVNVRFANKQPVPEEFLCIDRKGDVIKPNALTKGFKELLKNNDMRLIRFHDLRHGCANMLISERVPLVEAQQWMGRSSFQTTVDMYSHLGFDTKMKCVDVINQKFTDS